MTPRDFWWTVVLGIAIGVVCTLMLMAKGYIIPPREHLPVDTIVIPQTIYAPPPGWSEAFRLECNWVRKEESSEPVR